MAKDSHSEHQSALPREPIDIIIDPLKSPPLPP
jgi:hypothetical protein